MPQRSSHLLDGERQGVTWPLVEEDAHPAIPAITPFAFLFESGKRNGGKLFTERRQAMYQLVLSGFNKGENRHLVFDRELFDEIE